MSKLTESLLKLDVNNDDHWTTDGAPRLDALEAIHGSAVSRGDVTVAAPKFSRKNPTVDATAPAATAPAQAAKAAPAPTAPAKDENGPSEQTGAEEGDLAAELKAVNAKMEKARKVLNAAQKEMAAVVAEADAIMLKKAAEESGQTLADDIKAFQMSQRAQRTQSYEQSQAMAKLLAENGFR